MSTARAAAISLRTDYVICVTERLPMARTLSRTRDTTQTKVVSRPTYLPTYLPTSLKN